ncbi:hypothetical protein [Streptomyces sp. NPDC056296]|uniref:hypothetical protein n=1 Tax=Streptomyces sp. NPDC056296 TaxID=3345775 RepID=UPI0035DE6F8F
MGESETMDVHKERTRAERLTEGLTVAVASVLSFGLLSGSGAVFGAIAWHLVTDTGTTAFSRLSMPVLFLVVVALPPLVARRVFLSRRRKGTERVTAAVPAALTLLATSVVPFAILCLVVVYAD